MKIGLFFGSFNPIHMGHLMIAGYMAYHTDLEKVWMVVSPQNPFKEKSSLIHAYDRLEMVRLALENAENIEACDVEFYLPKPSYTIDTLTFLTKKYPRRQFALIMGGDNLMTLHKWKNYQQLIQLCDIYVYPRLGNDLSAWKDQKGVIITDSPLIDISASFIRQSYMEKKSVQYFIPEKVHEFIAGKNLYRIKNGS